MNLAEVLTQFKTMIESDSWFDDFAIPGVGSLIVDDLIPADKESDKLEEVSLREAYDADGGPPKRGIAIVAWLDEGDQVADIEEDLHEQSILMVAVRENYQINRNASLGSEKTALEVMQRIKAATHGQFYENGTGYGIQYVGYAQSNITENPGEIIYYLEYRVTTAG